MIRKGNDDEIAVIADVINDGASAYKGVIPADRWQEPYMPMDYLTSEIEAGVKFWVDDQAGGHPGAGGPRPGPRGARRGPGATPGLRWVCNLHPERAAR